MVGAGPQGPFRPLRPFLRSDSVAARALPTAAVSAIVVTVAEPGGTDPDRDTLPPPLASRILLLTIRPASWEVDSSGDGHPSSQPTPESLDFYILTPRYCSDLSSWGPAPGVPLPGSL